MKYADKAYLALGRTIRALRLERDLSQEEFAHIADLDRSYVGQVEREQKNISLKNLLKFSKALEIPVAKLLESVK